MQEDLIGYLLGALEPEEMERVAEALRRDPALRAELERLRLAMKPLDQLEEIYEPPGDLLSKTLEAVDQSQVTKAVETDSPGLATANIGSAQLSSERGWELVDVLGMCAAVAILVGLVLPGILRQRAAARVATCQAQLREAGTALIHYLTRTSDGRFPGLEREGPLSFSGMYAIELAEHGLLPNREPLWCPSLDAPEQWYGQPIPTRRQVLAATPIVLRHYQQGVGGHYAYSLGIFERGRYTAPRFQGRSGFAILADAPQHTLNGWRMAHEGQGFNVLYEDGHVEFLTEQQVWLSGDHPFLNRSGEMQAGLDPDDASLAPSHSPPFLPAGYSRSSR